MSATRKTTTKLAIEGLETRSLMSVTSVVNSDGLLKVFADDAMTRAEATTDGHDVTITDLDSGDVWSVPLDQIYRIKFIGGAADDRFTSFVNEVPLTARGNDGNDTLTGTDRGDKLVGGTGDDKLVGGAGDDLIRGFEGNDTLIGGAGSDTMEGRDGDDVLVAIDDGATDSATGGPGDDVVWADDNGDTWDRVADESEAAWVGWFANGADRTLDGDAIDDPDADPALVEAGFEYKTFAGDLFAAGGPSIDDIGQGRIGDCWLLSGLAVIAYDNPTAIRRHVVDFGDGTYGVHLGDSFYRVDADLPVSTDYPQNPAYARLGGGGSLWVAIAEKAYAQFRTLDGVTNSYKAIDGGFPLEVNVAFGATDADWKNFSDYASAEELGADLYARWNNYEAMTMGFYEIPAGVSLIGGHAYTLSQVDTDADGNVVSVTVRNPWAVDGQVEGAAADANPGDGYVTLDIHTLYTVSGSVAWGKV